MTTVKKVILDQADKIVMVTTTKKAEYAWIC